MKGSIAVILITFSFENPYSGKFFLYILVFVYSLSLQTIIIHYAYRYFALCRFNCETNHILKKKHFRVNLLILFSTKYHALLWTMICAIFSLIFSVLTFQVMEIDEEVREILYVVIFQIFRLLNISIQNLIRHFIFL